jgi:S-adenosylmethionine synthetase
MWHDLNFLIVMELVVRTRESPPPGSQEVEVVERKGLGHPDTICDAIAEHICVCLCRHYLEHFGHILHHNVDKILLVGGQSRASFGGGEVVEPIEIYIAGRATAEYGGVLIPVHDIAVEGGRDWLRTHLRGVDVDHDIRIIPCLRRGSAELVHLFDRGGAAPPANDTACGVGFSPPTDLERVVLQVEQALNSPETKRTHPEIGEDIKVMGMRLRGSIHLTIGCAFVSRFVDHVEDYQTKKEAARVLALDAARLVTALDVDAVVNAADDLAHERVFLTVTGTSAEAGDDGEAGRGNRACGLITPYRLMIIESVAGKNPVTHVGKLYNLLAGRIAAAVTDDVPGVSDAECLLASEIGRTIADPRVVDVRLGCDDAVPLVESVKDVVRSELEQLPRLRELLFDGRMPLY